MMQGIYEIVNLQDGKASTYIGNSLNIEKRWRQHRWKLRNGRHDNAHLQAAWDKYGECAFVFSVLEEVGDDMLLIMEQEYLNDYFDRGHCYNIATTAGPAGTKSEEHKRKIGEAMKGNQNALGHRRTEETKRKISSGMAGKRNGLGHRHTEESKRKMSMAKMGKKPNDETRRKLSAAGKGRKHTDETRRKMSEAHKGHTISKETRRKISIAMLGNQNHPGCKSIGEDERKTGVT